MVGYRLFVLKVPLITRVVFEAEASGGRRSKAGGLRTLRFPLSLPSPFPFPQIQ